MGDWRMGSREMPAYLSPSLSALGDVLLAPALMDQIWPWLLGSDNSFTSVNPALVTWGR